MNAQSEKHKRYDHAHPRISVRFESRAERDEIITRARDAGISVSDYVRQGIRQPTTGDQARDDITFLFNFFQQHKVRTKISEDEKARLKDILMRVKS